MPTYGRRPGTPDTGYGELLPGRMRGNNFGSYPRNAWVEKIGGRVGRNTAGTPTVRFATYRRDNRAKVGETGTSTAGSYMIDGHGGADIVMSPTGPMMIHAGVEHEITIHAAGSSASMGMGEWGHRMTEQSVSAPPQTYAPNWERPEGKMSLWLDVVDNRPPNAPEVMSPAPNSVLATIRPNLTVRHSDPDAWLGDKILQFQMEIWTATTNGGRGSLIHNSGVIGASAESQGNNVVGWLPPANLAGGRYIARAITWDMFGQPGAWREWMFTINSGGAVEGVDIGQDKYIAPGMVSDPAPYITGFWRHNNGLPGVAVTVTLRRASGTLVSGPKRTDVSATPWPNGMQFFIGLADMYANFPPLVPGDSYYVEVMIEDNSGTASPIARTPVFRMQGAPDTPIPVGPDNGAEVAAPPTLQLLAGDPEERGNDVEIQYQFKIGSGAWSAWKSFDYTFWADGFFWTQLTTTELTSKGLVTWKARATDRWGLFSAETAERTFLYTDPPVVTISSPANNATIATTTPPIAASANKPTTKFWYTITDAATAKVVYNRPVVTVEQPTTTWNASVPAARMVNTRRYVMDIYVETAGGLRGHKATTFTVSYPVPQALSSLSSRKVAGPFEPSWDQNEWSRILLEWDELPTGVAPIADFWGYVIERRSLATGEIDLRQVIRSRSQRTLLDTTPVSGVQYEYSVGWVRRVDASNYVVSAQVTVQNGVRFSNAIISDLSDTTLAAVLAGYSDRRVEWGAPKSVEIYDTWGELPIAFQSLNRGDTITATFVPVDDENGQFLHTDIIRAVKRMSGVSVDPQGRPVARALYYRDGKGRGMGCVIVSEASESDRAWINAGEISITLREIRVTLMEELP